MASNSAITLTLNSTAQMEPLEFRRHVCRPAGLQARCATVGGWRERE
jgi:hypothetical protein